MKTYISSPPPGSPPAGSVTLEDLAPLAAFSVIGNETASSATPTAVNLMGIPGQTSTATAAGTTTLTNLSKGQQIFTGATTQTVVLPVVSTLPILGFGYWIINNSSGALTVNSSGGNLVLTIAANMRAMVFCKSLTGTTAASWEVVYASNTLQMVTTQVSTNVGTKQNLLPAVPAGMKRIVQTVIARNPSTDLSAMADSLILGWNAGADNWCNGGSAGAVNVLSSTSGQMTIFPINFSNPDAPQVFTGAATEVFGVIFQDILVTATLTIDVFFYDVPA